MAKDYEYKVFGVVILNESRSNFTYKLRFPSKPRNDNKDTDWSNWDTNLIKPVFPGLGPRYKSDQNGGSPGLGNSLHILEIYFKINYFPLFLKGYFIEGFLTAQKAIDFSLISDSNPEVNKVNIELKRYSYPPYSDDNFIMYVCII